MNDEKSERANEREKGVRAVEGRIEGRKEELEAKQHQQQQNQTT